MMRKRRESDIVRACLQHLQILENNGTIHYVDRLNSGKMFVPGRNGKGYMVRLCREGTADILVVLRSGANCWIEVKMEGEPQRPKQKEFKIHMLKVPNQFYFIVHSLDELVGKLKELNPDR